MKKALQKWKKILGEARVLTDTTTLDAYAQDTAPGALRPAGVLKPKSTREVQQIVKIANEFRVSIYPLSKGKNWGYGARSAARPHNVIVDLGLMNSIVEVNQTLAYCVVEPGVTQGMMSKHLRTMNIPLWVDVTGSVPEASLVGNTLERGFGHTLYGDHFRTLCGLEVVLANGDIIQTGFGHFAGARATRVFPYGVGPYLDGLFTQSNFGIVTKMGLWLMPVPEKMEAYFLNANLDTDLEEVVEKIRRLRFMGVIQSEVHIANEARVAATIGSLKQNKYPAWSASGALYGTAKEVAAKKAIVKEVLEKKFKVIFLDEKKLAWLGRFPQVAKALSGQDIPASLPILRAVFDLMRGIPSNGPTQGLYAENKKELPQGELDPARDGCGIYWFSPVLPADGASARVLMDICRPIFKRYEFEFQVTLVFLTDRSLGAVISIMYEKNNPAMTARAAACYDRLLADCLTAGFVPYRTGLHSMKKIISAQDPFWKTVARLKKAIDPKGILSPGRYSL